jgi:iron complex outermembrane receptor protein
MSIQKLKETAGLLVCLSSVTYGTHAQAPAASEQDTLDTVVVTAQKRSERLQDVPITINVISGETASKKGVNKVEDVSVVVPGVYVMEQVGGAAPFIRGVGSLDSAPGNEPSTAIYVDGVYMATRQGNLFQFNDNDIDRIEVLKGPQGTLFGRNAAGGVIQIVTKDPSHDTQILGDVGYGNYDTKTADIYATTGLGESLAVDFSAHYSDQSDGWGHNLFTGQEVNLNDEYGARSKLLWTPSDRTTVKVAVDFGYSRSDLTASLQALPGTTTLAGSGYPGNYNTNSDLRTPLSLVKSGGGSIEVDHTAEWAKLVSITSWRDTEAAVDLDVDGSPVFLFDAYANKIVTTTTTQEFQVISLPDSRITWIGGLYLLYQDAGYNQLELSGLGLAPATFENIYSIQRTTSYSAFAQATAPLPEHSDATAGLRYTFDNRELNAHLATDFGEGPLIHQAYNAGKLTYKAALDHKFTEEVLGYISYSLGFKSGVFNTVSPSDPPVKPEIVDAYEAGIKSELLDHRLRINAAGFFYNYDNMQLTRIFNGGTQLFNAAKSQMKGADLDLDAVVARGLTLQAGLSYLDAKFVQFPNAPIYLPSPTGGNVLSSGNAAGNSLPIAPTWQANVGGDYSLQTDVGTFGLSAVYSYNSGYYFTVGDRSKQSPINMVNASVSWTGLSGWGLKLWGKNLANKYYYVYADEQAFGDIGSPGAPRTYGVTATFKYK